MGLPVCSVFTSCSSSRHRLEIGQGTGQIIAPEKELAGEFPPECTLRSSGCTVLDLVLGGVCCHTHTLQLSVSLTFGSESMVFKQPDVPTDLRVENQQVECTFSYFWTNTFPGKCLKQL